MWESFDWAKNKIYDTYSSCKNKLSLTALAVKEKIPAQTRDILSRPFSKETREFIQNSPETQRALKVTITANVLYASISMMNQFNNYLLNENVPTDEYSIERYSRYMAHIANNFLWLFVIRKYIRMLVENALNGTCVAQAVVLDHPDGHHQKDCKEKHPELKIILVREVSRFNLPYIIKQKIEQKIDEYQKILNAVRYMISVQSGGLASGVYYIVDIQLVKMLCAYLPYGKYMEILLRALVIGHSLPEYNYANQCTQHKHEEIRRLSAAAVVIGFFHAMVVESVYSLTGNSYVKDAVGSVLYQMLIPVMMSKPINSEKDGADYFYYNRAIASTIMEVIANKTLNVLKEGSYTLQLMYEESPEKIKAHTIYLYLANNKVDMPRWTLRRRKKIAEPYIEWIEISVVNAKGEIKKIKLSEEKLGEHAESIKTVLRSKGEIKILANEDKQALYMLFAELGFYKPLGMKLQEMAQAPYIQFTKDIFISSDLQSLNEFVRKPDVKRYLDYNVFTFKKVRAGIDIIRDSYLAKAGSMLPNWWIPENLQNIKIVLEALFLSKSKVVLASLDDLLAAHQKHLSECEESILFKAIHTKKELAHILQDVDAEYTSENEKKEEVVIVEENKKPDVIEVMVTNESEPIEFVEITIEKSASGQISAITSELVSAKFIENNLNPERLFDVTGEEKPKPLDLLILNDYKEEKPEPFNLPIIDNYRDSKEEEKKEEKSFTLFDEEKLFGLSDKRTIPAPTAPTIQQPFLVGGSIMDISFFDYDPSNNKVPTPTQTVSRPPTPQYQ